MQAKAKIMVVRDVERDDMEYLSKTLCCKPVSHVDHMRPEALGSADLVQEVQVRRSHAPCGRRVRAPVAACSAGHGSARHRRRRCVGMQRAQACPLCAADRQRLP